MTLISESRTDAQPVDGGCPPPADRTSLAPRADAGALARQYREVRSASDAFAATLLPEDMVIQTMPDVSPTKWHLAHTSWFFETFLLKSEKNPDAYAECDPLYGYLFNSYYVSVGDRHCRMKRGTISRPTIDDVRDYRRHVDRHMARLLDRLANDAALASDLAPLVEVGLHHEQQHQELMATDIKHVFACNPTYPKLHDQPIPGGEPTDLKWLELPEGVVEIGHDGRGFAYDNEGPRHKAYLHGGSIASRPVTNRDWQAFIDDGGYTTPALWLSAGWAIVEADRANWSAPLYWEKLDGQWHEYTLGGMRPIEPDEPVCHVSYYEADAFARWADARLPTEAERETAERSHPSPTTDFAESARYHPRVPTGPNLAAARGGVWEWCATQYLPYPGYRPPPGALGEYNGKFMANQFILKGGSVATPKSHYRPTYRNFFPPEARWQFSGLRLAR